MKCKSNTYLIPNMEGTKMKVMKINNINTHIKFRENTASATMSNREAGLMIQSQNAAVNFARDRYIAEQAGSVEAGPLKALGYKLYRTFGYLTNHETPKSNKQLNVVA